MGVSENSGTPKSSIFTGFSIINPPFWGPTPVFGNTHMSVCIGPCLFKHPEKTQWKLWRFIKTRRHPQKTNMVPLKRDYFRRKWDLNQPLIFRGHAFVFPGSRWWLPTVKFRRICCHHTLCRLQKTQPKISNQPMVNWWFGFFVVWIFGIPENERDCY